MAARKGRVLRPWNSPGLSGEPCSLQMVCGLKNNPMHFKRPCSGLSKSLSGNLHLHSLVGPALLGFLTAYLHASCHDSLAHTLLVCIQESFHLRNSADGEGRTEGGDTDGEAPERQWRDLRPSPEQASLQPCKPAVKKESNVQRHGSSSSRLCLC